ncbi:MAG: hypothetical protein LUE21_10260 [Oscillospiraceae bacterium]|nr:hypothetical protein [Oscillospiraceae bacterium]
MKNPWDDVFDEVPASFRDRVDRTLRGLEDRPMKHEHEKIKRTVRMTARTGLIAAAVAVLLIGSALAAAAHTGFFRDAFGDNGTGHEAYTLDKTDETGSAVSQESYPAVERVEADDEQAQTLVGAYVTEVQASVTIGAYTFTVEDAVMDENGIGAATVTVENPNGFPDESASEGYTLNAQTGQGELVDFTSLLLEDDSTDTCRRYACYFAPFEELNGENIRLEVAVVTDLGDTAEIEREYVTIAAEGRVPAGTFSDGELTASVSAVGMEIAWPRSGASEETDEYLTDEIIIRYADGSEYTVESDEKNVYNLALTSADGETHTWYVFNRLTDTDSITEIELTGSCAGEAFSYTLTPAD